MFLGVKPNSANILIPDTTIDANNIVNAPPNTGYGIVWITAATGGNKPAMIKINAPNKIVNLLTTFVCPTIPTFWEKVVNGKQPKQALAVDTKPSQARAPLISLSVGNLPKPSLHVAVTSPIPSVDATKKIKQTGKIAPISNLISPKL